MAFPLRPQTGFMVPGAKHLAGRESPDTVVSGHLIPPVTARERDERRARLARQRMAARAMRGMHGEAQTGERPPWGGKPGNFAVQAARKYGTWMGNRPRYPGDSTMVEAQAERNRFVAGRERAAEDELGRIRVKYGWNPYTQSYDLPMGQGYPYERPVNR